MNSLRVSATTTNDLAEAFKRVLETTPIHSLAATISVSGDVRDIHPIVRDEVYRVGYEAIRNAHAHSGGNHLEVQLRYADDLTLRVTDNGMGSDASTFSAGKEGHYGVRGMRERAGRIGAKLILRDHPLMQNLARHLRPLIRAIAMLLLRSAPHLLPQILKPRLRLPSRRNPNDLRVAFTR